MIRGAGWMAAGMLAACAPQQSAPAAPLRLQISATECTLGQPLLLTVQREWASGSPPAPWDPASLEPLRLERTGAQRQIFGELVRETLQYRAVAFAAGELDFPPHFRLRVRSDLPADDAGEPEAPSALSAGGSRAWLLLLLLPLLGFAMVRARRRHAPAAAEPAPPPGAARRLRDLDAQSADFPAELLAVLRDRLAERAGVRAPGRLASELLASDPGLAPPARAQLLEIVRQCEEQRYAGLTRTPDQRRSDLAAVAALTEDEA